MWGWVGLDGCPRWGGERVPPGRQTGQQDAGDHEGNKCRSQPLLTTLAFTTLLANARNTGMETNPSRFCRFFRIIPNGFWAQTAVIPFRVPFANNGPCAAGAPPRMKFASLMYFVYIKRISGEVRCRAATHKGMKMGYTAARGERTEVGWMLVQPARRRKLTRVRPGYLSVAASRDVSTSKKLVVDPRPTLMLFLSREQDHRKREEGHAGDSRTLCGH